MGKSNNFNHKFQEIYDREKKINNFFKENEIQILENIHFSFLKKIKIDFSNFFKNDIKLVSCSIKTELYNRKDIKNLSCINLINISSNPSTSFIVFSSNFLSVMIDLLFGGNYDFIDNKIQKKDITSSELFINQKIITFITNRLSDSYRKFFSEEIMFTHIQVLTNLKKFDFDFNKFFLISRFDLEINNIKIFFVILIPLAAIKEFNKKIVTPISENKKDIDVEENVSNAISFENIYNVELNILARIINISISYEKLNSLSVGNILSIKKPEKIIVFVEKKPIFFASYKSFDDKSILFIEEFIHNNFDYNQEEDITLMNHVKKSTDDEKLLGTEDTIAQSKNINKHVSLESTKTIDNKKILMDTVVNVVVELGKTKIKIKDFLGFSVGSVLILDKLAKEPLDIFINNSLVASGEIVFLENKYGLRITNLNNSLKKL